MFRWENFSKTLLRDLARERGLRVTFAVDDLTEVYGNSPDFQFVNDTWPVLRDRWLAGTPVSRTAVTAGLRAKGVGSKSARLGSKAGQMEYLESCRLSDSLRAIVVEEFIRAGSLDILGADGSADAITPSSSTAWPAPVGQQHRKAEMTEPTQVSTRDAGLKAVDLLFEQLMIDEQWAVRRPRGFTWWSYRLAQHVEAEEPKPAADGAMGSVVRVWTEVVREVPKGNTDVAMIISTLNMQESMSAVVWNRDTGTIDECATSPMYDDTVDAWVPLLATAAILQNTAAHSRAHALAEVCSGIPASSDHPGTGERPVMDDLLDGPAAWTANGVGMPSRFEGVHMLALAAYTEKCGVLGSGDERGFTCEVPFIDDVPSIVRVGTGQGGALGTALVQAFTDQPHPQLGTGVLWLVRLPTSFDPKAAPMLANDLNLLGAHRRS
jgi:hypothetical protein